ncbi:hypothetical protein EDI_256560 [Entamoeba dispar SAW760]|uniref:Ribonuclease H n=1 Tax=Entamoeba dispar (strain ATCC PRA-260 / SAW760) TaxID=370354 RepID=B0EHM6_ENTDS|nr:uncharacterized protein EDI_256560 [Entamoeba dispar SAW760]EDR25960.1 hypothetical protein EDI_256560 [Entamoeba dispar SAW760]|eukprot:EDR25960.1 hypothetical protein EDI_256560 [Entamoeba dispar SAW760]
MPKKTKWYVVFEGRKRGIYTSWDVCSSLVKGFSQSKYKSYLTQKEAEDAFQNYITIHPNPITNEEIIEKQITNDNNKKYNILVNEDIVVQSFNEIKLPYQIKQSNNSSFGIVFNQNKNGLIRTDINEVVIPGIQSIELYKKGLEYLFYNHLIEVGYKLIIPSYYFQQIQVSSLLIPLQSIYDMIIQIE